MAGSLMLGIAPAIAEEAAKEAAFWTLEELMQEMAKVKKSSATFTERKYLSMLKKPLNFSGTLEYSAPGRFEKITLLPKREAMVLDGDRLEVENGGANRKRVLSLQGYPAIWALVESIRSTLAGDAQTLNRFYLATLEGQRKQWQLELLPRDPKMRNMVTEIHISGRNEQISTIEIRESGGDYSVMEIKKVGS
jgi:outer membrane lipoprotein-sorting protein